MTVLARQTLSDFPYTTSDVSVGAVRRAQKNFSSTARAHFYGTCGQSVGRGTFRAISIDVGLDL
jgi:hypothetical protein